MEEARRGCGAPAGALTMGAVMGRPGLRDLERRCAGTVVATGLAGGEMGEDVLDDLGSFDAGDDAQRAATPPTVFDIDAEDSLDHGLMLRLDTSF